MSSTTPETAPPGRSRIQDSDAPMARFLMKDPVFQELEKLMAEGWKNKEDDWYWEQRKNNSKTANSDGKRSMFFMMEWVASQLDEATGAFTLDPDSNSSGDVPAVLDLALAPGGFSSYILSQNPGCEIDGFTLPEEDGGHEVLVDCDPERLSITTTDMTNFMGELGVEPDEIPEGHPDAEALLNAEWPYSRERYDLVIADGKPPTRTDDTQKPFREVGCALRATQIALALSKVRPGGTVVMLCFNSRRPRGFRLLYELNKISESIQLFKPEPMHAVKSSFYIVCRGVRTETPECKELIARYVNSWRRAVFCPSPSESEHPDGSEGDNYEQEQENESGHRQRPKSAAPRSEDGNGYSSVDGDGDGDSAVDVGPVGDPWLPPMDIAKLIDEFGEKYVALARPIWEVQIRGMRRTWSKLEGLRNKDEQYRYKAVRSNTDWKPKRLNVGGGGSSWGGYSKNGGDYDNYNNNKRWDWGGGGGGGGGGGYQRRSFGNERASERLMGLSSWRKS